MAKRQISSNPPLQRAFSTAEAANYIGRPASFLRQSRMRGKGDGDIPPPKYIKQGHKCFYLREDLDEWLDSFKKVTNVAQYQGA